MADKKISKLVRQIPRHWVGDGFPVRTLFSYHDQDAAISPFLLLDYAGPAEFPPQESRRGVGWHPHRGFETVTIVYQGEIEHQDTAGNKGRLGPGDVQWMTAARGVLHEEYHGQSFTKNGGTLEMVQLWVNLPAKDKMSPPGYQEILASTIPNVPLPNNAGFVRVIAGNYGAIRGAAKTFTPIHLWNIHLSAGHKAEFLLEEGFSAATLIRTGKVLVNSSQVVSPSELVIFELKGKSLSLEAKEDTQCLLISGQPLPEPIVGYGPFVMNTPEEIQQAAQDFQQGRF